MFVDILTLPYLQRPLILLLILGIVGGSVGVLVNLRAMEFSVEALVHSVFPGMVVGLALGGIDGIVPGAAAGGVALSGDLFALIAIQLRAAVAEVGLQARKHPLRGDHTEKLAVMPRLEAMEEHHQLGRFQVGHLDQHHAGQLLHLRKSHFAADPAEVVQVFDLCHQPQFGNLLRVGGSNDRERGGCAHVSALWVARNQRLHGGVKQLQEGLRIAVPFTGFRNALH